MKNKLLISKTPQKKHIIKILTLKIKNICSHNNFNFCKRNIFTSSGFTSINSNINSHSTQKDQGIFISLYISIKNSLKPIKTFPIYSLPKQSGKLYRVFLETFISVLGVGRSRVLSISNKTKKEIPIFQQIEEVKECRIKMKN